MIGRVPASTGMYDSNGKRGPALRAATPLDSSGPVPPSMPPGESAIVLAPGTRIGQYELIRELGRGGMGAVYAVRDTKLGRKVAIKFLSSNNHPELTARFILEAKATAQCSHENLIVIHEVGEHDGNPFMVLEYLQGAPLTQLLQDGHKLPPAQAVELMVPVVRALTVAHAHNIVHRDLKPDNIFVTDSGTIKVLDFGIAKLAQGVGEDGGALVRNAARASDASPTSGAFGAAGKPLTQGDRSSETSPGGRGSSRGRGQEARSAAGAREEASPGAREADRGVKIIPDVAIIH